MIKKIPRNKKITRKKVAEDLIFPPRYLSEGQPHIFKMRLDDGFATYEYDLNLTENWCMHDIYTELAAVLKRYGCSISAGELCGAGYLENEK